MRLSLLLLFIFCFFGHDVHAQTRIIAQVNDDIISELDLKQRLTFVQLTGQADTSRKDVQDQILKQLIDEKLKQQEAQEAGITISDQEVQNALKITLSQNGIDYDAMLKKLKENGIPVSVMEEQIKSDLMYVRAVKKNAGARGVISEKEIEAKMNEIKDRLNQKQYLISEIFLPVSVPEQDAEVYGQAMQLIMRIRDGESFEKIAEKYSKSDSAAKGGIVGWTGENDLSDEEKEEFSIMQPGQLSTPVKTSDGYKIFILHSIQDPKKNIENQDVVHLIQLFLPNDFSKQKQKELQRNLNMTKGSCEQFKNLSEQLKTSSRIDLGKVPVDKLPYPIQSIINRTALFEPSAPLPIEGGSLIFMICSKEKTSFLPEKEEIRMQLESVKLELLAQHRLKELRRTAVMEIRK